MTYEVKITGRAESDIDDVVERFAALPGPTIVAWTERLRKTIKDLGFLPRRFPATHRKDPYGMPLRICKFGKRRGAWLIYYSVNDDSKRVTVWTIQRAARGPQSTRDLS